MYRLLNGRVLELVDNRDSKSRDRKVVRVRLPPRPLVNYGKKKVLAYIVGIALGDGNISNPNGRAIRLRVTCDTKYPKLKNEIVKNLQVLLPANKVSTIHRKESYCDVSVYSNKFTQWLPWKSGNGSKVSQNARVPRWILRRPVFIRECLRGLLQTDGSIYQDRGYLMVNFTNRIPALANDVFSMIQRLGFSPTFHKLNVGRVKYTVRLARDTGRFVRYLQFSKD